jgi:NADH:ubiquinone oxidoreductase subunit 6 (subunit J)
MPLLLILIYVGAIAILFLFILTLINVKEQESDYISYNNNNILILINLLLLLLISYNSIIKYTGSNFNILDSLASQSGNGLDINIINELNIIAILYNSYKRPSDEDTGIQSH